MLEYPTVDMEEMITREMEENPALEEGNDDDQTSDSPDNESLENDGNFADDEKNNDDFSDDLDIMEQDFSGSEYDYISQKYSANDIRSEPTEMPFSYEQTFGEYLLTQLALLKEDEKIVRCAKFIIGNINDDGYLMREVENLVDDFLFKMNEEVSDTDMQKALEIVQSLDPAGVGAQNLQNCLLLQLKRFKQTQSVQIAEKIIENYFDFFSKKRYTAIINSLCISEKELQEAKEKILKLNPKPGSAFVRHSEIVQSSIVPDFIVEQDNNNLYVSLNNSNLPPLRVSGVYKKMADLPVKNSDKKNRQAVDFAKQKIDSARAFIEAIKQRNVTLLKTMTAITRGQRIFFLTGDESTLKPMRLKDISDVVDYDISTISRVSNSKYVQTQYGVFPLKFFFSESMKTESGEIVSNKKIQHIIKEIVDNENKTEPVTDNILTDMLKEKGYVIARRTVAKYREQLGIPSTHKRIESY
jgi:RNA polymerase sigma-54 factor